MIVLYKEKQEKKQRPPAAQVQGEQHRLGAKVGPQPHEPPRPAGVRVWVGIRKHRIVQVRQGHPVRRVLEAGGVQNQQQILPLMVAADWAEVPVACCSTWSRVNLVFAQKTAASLNHNPVGCTTRSGTNT